MAHYLMDLAIPFSTVISLRIPAFMHLFSFAQRMLLFFLPLIFLILLIRGSAKVRFFSAWAIVTLLPFSLFTLEPVSRYTYLPAVGFSVLVAMLIVNIYRLIQRNKPLTYIFFALLFVFFFAHAVESTIVDNVHEHHGNQWKTWIDEIQGFILVLPMNASIVVLNFPQIAIDRDVHLKAALRVFYQNEELAVYTVDDLNTTPQGAIVLQYRDGHIYKTG
jgi:hypothetical protein